MISNILLIANCILLTVAAIGSWHIKGLISKKIHQKTLSKKYSLALSKQYFSLLIPLLTLPLLVSSLLNNFFSESIGLKISFIVKVFVWFSFLALAYKTYPIFKKHYFFIKLY
jgi:hypothetical protein